MSGRVVHFEVPFEDQERASAFYGETLGWSLTPMPDLSYVMVSTGPSEQGPPSEPGFINGGMLQRATPVSSPVIVVEVDDIDDTLATVERLGGKALTSKESVGDMGFSAYFADPEGNVMGLWESA